MLKIRRLECSCAAPLEWRSTTESGVNAPLVVIGGESIQLAMQVEAVPEEGLVEILAPKGSDQPLDERMRARHEGDGLEFLDFEDAQIRPPAMKPEQWVMIGTEALGKWGQPKRGLRRLISRIAATSSVDGPLGPGRRPVFEENSH